MEKLTIENVEFIFDPAAQYKGKKFIAIRKNKKFGRGEKWQQITIALFHWKQFREWLLKILEKYEEEVPF